MSRERLYTANGDVRQVPEAGITLSVATSDDG